MALDQPSGARGVAPSTEIGHPESTPLVGCVEPRVSVTGAQLRGFTLVANWSPVDNAAAGDLSLTALASAAAQVLPWFSSLVSDQTAAGQATRLPDDIRDKLILGLPLPDELDNLEPFCLELERLCHASELGPRRLRLEFPESWLARERDQTEKRLNELHAAGFRLGVDRVGDSIASLTQLATLPLESLSFDARQVGRLLDQPQGEPVVRALVQLSHSIGLTTLAPGLANHPGLLSLERAGCDEVCGPYVCPPLDLTGASDWVQRRVTREERQRLADLHELNLLDTAAEERFDRITRLAQRVFGVNYALVTLVDEYRQWFKSRAGLTELKSTSRDVAFCDHTIRSPAVMVVEDTQLDPEFVDNPLVVGPPHLRFYAGYPLSVGEHSRIGALCLLHSESRRFSDQDRQLLTDIAALVEKELHTDMLASTDPLTGLLNRRGFSERAQDAVGIAADLHGKIALIFIDLDNLKQINDRQGHAVGDRAIHCFARLLQQTLRESDLIARYGGDEFVALLINADETDGAITLDRVRDAVDDFNATTNEAFELAFSVGCVIRDARGDVDIEALLQEADERMYRDKHGER